MIGGISFRSNLIETAAKIIEVVGGPNGSGKSTFASLHMNDDVFLNPDLIAMGISKGRFEEASMRAGRVMIADVKERIATGQSFAFESTLSGKSWVHALREAKQQGFAIVIYFLYLASVEKNVQRIAKRVKQGGHAIPEDSVKRRYPRCFENFWHLYRPLCDDWMIFDNSKSGPRLVQDKNQFDLLPPEKQATFARTFLREG